VCGGFHKCFCESRNGLIWTAVSLLNQRNRAMSPNLLPHEFILGCQSLVAIVIFLMLMRKDPWDE
jgi:hypothetical protein